MSMDEDLAESNSTVFHLINMVRRDSLSFKFEYAFNYFNVFLCLLYQSYCIWHWVRPWIALHTYTPFQVALPIVFINVYITYWFFVLMSLRCVVILVVISKLYKNTGLYKRNVLFIMKRLITSPNTLTQHKY